MRRTYDRILALYETPNDVVVSRLTSSGASIQLSEPTERSTWSWTTRRGFGRLPDGRIVVSGDASSSDEGSGISTDFTGIYVLTKNGQPDTTFNKDAIGDADAAQQ